MEAMSLVDFGTFFLRLLEPALFSQILYHA